MSIIAQAAPASAREWISPAARALVSAAVAAVITFSAVHDARLGLGALAAVAIVPPVVELAVRRGGTGGSERVSLLVRLIAGVVAGLGAIVAAIVLPGIQVFVYLACGWALVTGAAEGAAAIVARRRGRPFDGLIPGIVTVALGLGVLLVPVNLRQETRLDNGAVAYLDASVVVVGLFGAYAAVMAVYLAISAASSRAGSGSRAAAGATGNEDR